MSNWNNAYLIAGIRIEITSSVGDPTAYLPRDMPDFSMGGPGTADLAILFRDQGDAQTGPPRYPFPSHFKMESCREGLSFDGIGEGEKEPLGIIHTGCATAEMGLPPLDPVTVHAAEEDPVQEAVQAFVRACLQCRLMEMGGTLMHAAGVTWEGDGFVFTGHTRAGKTTLSRGFPAEAVLGDDLVAVREQREGFALYGTPWPGREGGTVAYGGVPLLAVFNLHPGSETGLSRQSSAQALAELATNAPRMGYEGEESKLLEVFSSLVEVVPIYGLSMRLGDDVTPYLLRVTVEEGGTDKEDRP